MRSDSASDRVSTSWAEVFAAIGAEWKTPNSAVFYACAELRSKRLVCISSARIYGNNNMHRMIADHGSVNEQAAALAKTLKITPEDNPTSKSLKDAQDANRTKLDALSGAAFDKAYADNEAAYHKSVDDALSNTLIPDAQNAELKSLLQSGLKIFQDHQRDAENIVKQLSVTHQ